MTILEKNNKENEEKMKKVEDFFFSMQSDEKEEYDKIDFDLELVKNIDEIREPMKEMIKYKKIVFNPKNYKTKSYYKYNPFRKILYNTLYYVNK